MIELELRRVMHKRTRVYSMVATRDLFGSLVLRVRYGRLGWRTLREREEAFTTEHALTTRVRELVTTRLHHGYTACAGDVALYDARRKRTRMPMSPELEALLVAVEQLAITVQQPPTEGAQHAFASLLRQIIQTATAVRKAHGLPDLGRSNGTAADFEARKAEADAELSTLSADCDARVAGLRYGLTLMSDAERLRAVLGAAGICQLGAEYCASTGAMEAAAGDLAHARRHIEALAPALAKYATAIAVRH